MSAGALAGEVGAMADLMDPSSSPAVADLGGFWTDAAWLSGRASAITANLQQGARLMTLANSADCLYFARMCSADIGRSDTDDRRTMHLGVAGERRVDVTLQQHGWWWNIPVAHGDVMASYPRALLL